MVELSDICIVMVQQYSLYLYIYILVKQFIMDLILVLELVYEMQVLLYTF